MNNSKNYRHLHLNTVDEVKFVGGD